MSDTRLYSSMMQESPNLDHARGLLNIATECARINDRIHGGNTLLHYVADLHEPPEVVAEMIQLLLNKGADSSIRNNNGFIPLHLAVRVSNRTLALKALLTSPTARIDVSTRTTDGRSALMLAVCQRHLDTVEFLLDHGVDATDRETMRLALQAKHRGIISALLIHGAFTDSTLLVQAIETGDRFIVEMFLNRNQSVNSKHELTGITMLMRAIWQRDTKMFSMLVDHGADMSARDLEGKTIIHHAAEQGAVDILNILISNGGDILEESDDRSIPRDFAEHGWNAWMTGSGGHRECEQCAVILDDLMRQHRLDTENMLLAYHMGDHVRLGTHSRVRQLDPDVLRLISLQFQQPEREYEPYVPQVGDQQRDLDVAGYDELGIRYPPRRGALVH
jgi:ankyrin repeat protein